MTRWESSISWGTELAFVTNNIGFTGTFSSVIITSDIPRSWTSLYMDGTAVKLFLVICPHEAGTWDPNYTPGVDFLDHDFL